MDLRVPDRLPPELLLEKEAVWRVQDQGDGRILRGHATRRLGIRESGFARQSEGGRDDVVQLADVGVARTGTDTIKLYLLQPSNSIQQSFFNGPTPASFLFILYLLKQTINFLQQINAKNVMSIQYRVPVFKPILSNLNRLP